MSILADFAANFLKFQIFLEESSFVVQKRLLCEKAFIFMLLQQKTTYSILDPI